MTGFFFFSFALMDLLLGRLVALTYGLSDILLRAHNVTSTLIFVRYDLLYYPFVMTYSFSYILHHIWHGMSFLQHGLDRVMENEG